MKAVKIPEDIHIASYMNTRVFWINKDHNLSDKPENSEDAYATFSKKSGEEKNIVINEAALEKVEKVIGSFLSGYFEAYISNDGNHVIYRSEDYKVYYLDLTTGESKWLFSGCGLNWSPNETKISYGLPHAEKLDDVDDWNSYNSYELDSYVYDFNTDKSIKVANFGIISYFSFDDKYMVFLESSYIGPRGGSI